MIIISFLRKFGFIHVDYRIPARRTGFSVLERQCTSFYRKRFGQTIIPVPNVNDQQIDQSSHFMICNPVIKHKMLINQIIRSILSSNRDVNPKLSMQKLLDRKFQLCLMDIWSYQTFNRCLADFCAY